MTDAAPAGAAPRPIGIAIVVHAGRVLVGVRGPDGPLPGMAEFPGGKCEEGESPQACAVRETQEECGLEVAVHGLLPDVVWSYPHGPVHLHFVLCRPARCDDVRESHQGFRWVGPDELPRLNFPEANREPIAAVVELLRRAEAE